MCSTTENKRKRKVKPATKEITHLELLQLSLAKAGGARELNRIAKVGRVTIYRLQHGLTSRLQEPTVQKLWGYLHGE